MDDRQSEGTAPFSGDAKLFIANIPYNMRESELQDMFEKYGKISEVRIATDRDTGRPKGFAFITMSDGRDAADAIKGLSGFDMDGRPLKVEYANTERKSSGDRSRNPGICYDFQKGICSRGDSCRFSHNSGDSDRNDRRDDRGGRDRDSGYGRDDRGGRDRDRDSGYGRDRDRNYGRDRDDYDDRRGGRDDRRGGRDDRDRSRDRDRRY